MERKVKTVMFDMGGVIFTLDQPEAIRRLTALGLSDATKQLDPYTQGGIFGDLESGTISPDEFRKKLSELAHRPLTFDDCRHAWLGYVKEVPQRNLDLLRELRQKGYRLLLLSNTNPFMMSWVNSNEFDGKGHSLESYLDKCYLSYEMKMMKPDENIFRQVLMSEQCFPHEILFVDDSPRNVSVASQIGIQTFCPKNGCDWTKDIYNYL